MSHDRICTFNASVVRINGNTIRVGAPTESPYDVLFRSSNLTLTSSYGRCGKVMIALIRVELHCTHHDRGQLQRSKLSYGRICNFNVSILCKGVPVFHFKNGHIKVINPTMRKLKSLQWVPIITCATQLNPNQPTYYFTALPVYELVSTKFVPLKSAS